jgi:glycosyltransferase involved in cell wall biosynthesis
MSELSVVIATYNRAERLKACLDGLAAQANDVAGGDFDVIVVIDGSTDGTRELLESYRAPFACRAVWQENAGQPSALNRGVAEATGRFCLLMDDDILAGRGMVAEHLRAQREGGGILAVGRLRLLLPENPDWYVRRFARGWAGHYARLDSGERALTASACYGGNLSFPRDAFLATGGFAPELPRAFDVDLAHRLIASGLKPRYLPSAEGVQDERKTWRELLRDEEGAGAGVVALYRRDRSTLPLGGLTDFRRAGPVSTALRSLLLATDVRPESLGRFGPLFDRASRGGFFRFVRSYAFWRGVRRAAGRDQWEQLTGAVTILMYHAVSLPGEHASRFVVAAQELEWQIRWLVRAGYRILDLEEYVRTRQENRLPPARSVVVTFDDGYSDNEAIAAPILARHGTPPTIFLVTDRVGDANRWDTDGALAGRRLLSWDEIRSLEKAGVRFAPHGRTHRGLQGLSEEELADEIGGAWAAMRRELARPVPILAFPFGLHDAAARAASSSFGLVAACTAKPGRNTLRTPLDSLRRAEIGGRTSRLRFRIAVRLGDTRPIRNRRRLRS